MRPPPESPSGIDSGTINVKSAVGLVITLGAMILFLVYSPPVRWFFALTLPAGILVGVVLYLLRRR